MISASIGSNAVKNAVNVMDFGADNTGTRSSSAAFAAAAASADDKSGGLGGTVFVPAGEYTVQDAPLSAGASVDTFQTRPITWVGAGAGQTYITVPDGEAGFVTTKSGTHRGGGVYGLTIKGDGNSPTMSNTAVEADWYDSGTPANAATTTGILLDNGAGNEIFDFTVSECDIKNHRYGVKYTGRGRSPKFHNNNVWHCHHGITAPEHPLFSGTNDLRYNWICYTSPAAGSNHIFDCTFIGVKFMYSEYGIVHDDEALGVSNCTFNNCIFGMNRKASVVLNTESNINGCYFITTSDTYTYTLDEAVLVKGRGNAISSNLFESFGNTYTNANIHVNPTLSAEQLLTVANNTFASTTDTASGEVGLPILFAGTRFDGAVISGNAVAMSNGTDVQFVSSPNRLSYSSITGNVLHGETTHANGTGVAISLAGSGCKYNTVTGNVCYYDGTSTGSSYFLSGYLDYSAVTGNTSVRGGHINATSSTGAQIANNASHNP